MDAPVAVGGLGGPALRVALSRLDDFTDEGRRLEGAQRTASSRDDTDLSGSTVTRLRGLEQDRSQPADRTEQGRDGHGHLDRDAG